MRFLYQKNKEIGSADESGKIVELRVLGRDTGIDVSVAVELDGKAYVPVHNHRGSITALVDADTNTVVESYRHSAFGEEQIFNANGEPVEESQIGNPWRYSSKRIDEETGHVFFGLRYYEPSIGRWITTDPAGFSDGPNLYAYVHGNPMRYYDPYGLWSMEGAMESVRDFCSDLFSGSNDDGSMSGGDVAMAGGALVLTAPALVAEGGAVAVITISVAAAYTGKALFDCVSGDRFSKGRADTSGADVKVPERSVDGISEASNDSVESPSDSSKERGKRRKNWLLEGKGEPGAVDWNKPGTAGRKNGDDGWPEIEFNKGYQGKKTPEVERGDHIHDWKPNPYHPDGKPTRQPGRLPTPQDLEIFGI